mmetsp:Transcript_24960/g.66726  ORF Transcript_24960/g.66726 Transcript_24960/m.66726 type:complete len:201 (-) Transcript_24960:35-637(-)
MLTASVQAQTFENCCRARRPAARGKADAARRELQRLGHAAVRGEVRFRWLGCHPPAPGGSPGECAALGARRRCRSGGLRLARVRRSRTAAGERTNHLKRAASWVKYCWQRPLARLLACARVGEPSRKKHIRSRPTLLAHVQPACLDHHVAGGAPSAPKRARRRLRRAQQGRTGCTSDTHEVRGHCRPDKTVHEVKGRLPA